MQKVDMEQNVKSRGNKRQPWRVRLGLLAVALLLPVALASVAVDYLVPTAPDRPQGVAARVGWYLQHGQLQADVRTLVATVRYVADSDGDIPAVTNYVNLPVAGNAAPASPKS